MSSDDSAPLRITLRPTDASPASKFCRLMERLAQADRQTLRLRFGEPCDPRRLADLYDIGWIIEKFSDYAAFFGWSIDEAAAHLADLDGWSSLTMRLPTGTHVMLVNACHGPRRRSLDIAHEFGHLVRGHAPVALDRVNGLFEHPQYSEHQEKEAYAYGLALLVPYAALVQFLEHNAPEAAIATYYGLSIEALRMRQKLLGLWDQR